MKVKQEVLTVRRKMSEIKMQLKPCIQDYEWSEGDKMFSEHAKYLKPHD